MADVLKLKTAPGQAWHSVPALVGPPGDAATITVGTVTTGEPGTAATVTNRGTEYAAIFDFTIPKGQKGDAGQGSGDMLKTDYDPDNGMRQVAFKDQLHTHDNKSVLDTITTVLINRWNTVLEKYVKPDSGIPKSDLASDVQTSLGKADTAIQSLSAYRTSAAQDVIDATKADATDVEAIEELIPSQATSSNQLADKSFVNSSIATNTANYISDNGQPFTSVAALEAYSGTVTNNDYAFVTGTDTEGNTYYDRYKATVSGSTVTWAKEFRLNNSSFTAAQWAAITSGITSSLVTAFNAKYDLPSTGVPKTDLASDVQTSLGLADTALQSHQDISGKEDNSNKVTSLSSSSTDTQYPSAKCVYDLMGDVESALAAL